MPEVDVTNHHMVEIYNLCGNARDGLSGNLSYSVLLDVAKSFGVKEFDDLLYFANQMEHHLNKKRESNKKTK